MPDIIKLKPHAQLTGDDLAPGEIAIDEAGRALYIDRGDSHPPEPIPLDVIPVPPAPEETPENAVAVLGGDGTEYRPYTTGGGGRPLGEGWLTPGVLCTHFTTRNANLRIEAVFELPHTTHLIGMRMHPAAGIDIQVTWGIAEMDDDVIVDDLTSAYAGAAEIIINETLPPGRYKVFVDAELAHDFQCLAGVAPWGRTTTYFPVFLRAADAAEE